MHTLQPNTIPNQRRQHPSNQLIRSQSRRPNQPTQPRSTSPKPQQQNRNRTQHNTNRPTQHQSLRHTTIQHRQHRQINKPLRQPHLQFTPNHTLLLFPQLTKTKPSPQIRSPRTNIKRPTQKPTNTNHNLLPISRQQRTHQLRHTRPPHTNHTTQQTRNQIPTPTKPNSHHTTQSLQNTTNQSHKTQPIHRTHLQLIQHLSPQNPHLTHSRQNNLLPNTQLGKYYQSHRRRPTGPLECPVTELFSLRQYTGTRQAQVSNRNTLVKIHPSDTPVKYTSTRHSNTPLSPVTSIHRNTPYKT